MYIFIKIKEIYKERAHVKKARTWETSVPLSISVQVSPDLDSAGSLPAVL